jgi:carboxyl-terminal processing protease
MDNETSLDDMVSALVASIGDEYSFFVPKDKAQDYQENISGQFEGIGTYLTKTDPSLKDPKDKSTYMIKVTSPFVGGPAQRAGLRSGDLISEVDGEPVDELTATEASNKIKGKAGTKVKLTVWRGENQFTVSIARELIDTPTVQYDMIKNHIGYLNISQFTSETSTQVEKALTSMLKNPLDSLILDLRDNGGGNVQECEKIAGMFLDHKLIMTEKFSEASKRENKENYASEGTLVPSAVQIVILVNGGSASASEILTSALKDNMRATVIGSTTYGKGVEQEILPFNDGYLQVTIAHYYTASGEDIHKKGIKPNIEITTPEYSKEQLQAIMDLTNDKVLSDYVTDHPSYSTENINNFALLHKDSLVDKNTLCILIRNEYLYSMDMDERPKYDLTYDTALIRAVSFLETGK